MSPLAERLLTILLPESHREALIGDLCEEDTRMSEWREVSIAFVHAVFRMARILFLPTEVTVSGNGDATNRPVAFVLALGVLGGAALIVTVSLTRRGPLIFLPYSAIVLAGATYLRLERVRPFSRRFALSVGSFMVATLIFYLYIFFVHARPAPQISLWGHAWRVGLMLLIGSALGGAVAQLTTTREAEQKAV